MLVKRPLLSNDDCLWRKKVPGIRILICIEPTTYLDKSRNRIFINSFINYVVLFTILQWYHKLVNTTQIHKKLRIHHIIKFIFSANRLFVYNGRYLKITYSLYWRTFHVSARGKLTLVSGHYLTRKWIYNQIYFQLAKGLSFQY